MISMPWWLWLIEAVCCTGPFIGASAGVAYYYFVNRDEEKK